MAAHFRAIRFWQDLARKYRLSTVGADTNHESIILEIEQLLQDTALMVGIPPNRRKMILFLQVHPKPECVIICCH